MDKPQITAEMLVDDILKAYELTQQSALKDGGNKDDVTRQCRELILAIGTTLDEVNTNIAYITLFSLLVDYSQKIKAIIMEAQQEAMRQLTEQVDKDAMKKRFEFPSETETNKILSQDC